MTMKISYKNTQRKWRNNMAQYDVRLSKDGIEAGMLNKNGQWHSGSDVTEKAFEVVRDHLLRLTAQQQHDVAYAWNYTNGKTLLLKLEEKDTEQLENKQDVQEGEQK